jgi:hypothetical protein
MARGVLYEAVQAVSDALKAIGIQPVLDPRNARPNSVLVELPTADLFTYNVADVRIPVRLLGTPPGNQDSAEYLMTLADKVIDSDLAVVDARPGVATYGQQEMPSYDLTVKISVKRN